MISLGIVSLSYLYYYHFNKPAQPMIWPVPQVVQLVASTTPAIILPTIPIVVTPTPTVYTMLIEEAGSAVTSLNPTWWLNSGGLVNLKNNIISTIQGDLAVGSKWQSAYAESNPVDTDGGVHPQNIFRLVSRQPQTNFQQQVYFKINQYRLSNSPNRNESNGVLLFNRYQDGNNLYYAGIRVDGNYVIKKKKNGIYYTMGIKKYWPGIFNRSAAPNLIPAGRFMGLKTEVTNIPGGVRIQLFSDTGGNGQWLLELDVADTQGKFGGTPIINAGMTGIRSDFLDGEFKDYSVKSL
jgi:hypothetical protein